MAKPMANKLADANLSISVSILTIVLIIFANVAKFSFTYVPPVDATPNMLNILFALKVVGAAGVLACTFGFGFSIGRFLERVR